MKRLFYDIETSLSINSSFGCAWNTTIGPNDIIIYPRIICICFKWEGEKKVHSLEWDLGDDYKMIKDFIKIMDKADIIVGHNADGFDQPWIRRQAIYHRIPMGQYIEEDTLKLARKRAGKGFKFESNRLDAIAKFLGVGQKIKTDRSLWEKITYPTLLKELFPIDKKYFDALHDMIKYCKMDVKVLESVYKVLAPYSPVKMHLGMFKGGNKWDCAKCGSGNTKVNKRFVTALGQERVNWYCQDCKTYSHTTASSVHKAKIQWLNDFKKLK